MQVMSLHDAAATLYVVPMWTIPVPALSGSCSESHASVVLAGHMHPPFFAIMDEIQEGLRYVFQTKSKYVCLISGTGHAGRIPSWPLVTSVIACTYCAALSEQRTSF